MDMVMILILAGGWEPHYSSIGVNGSMEDIPFPINHGILYYSRFVVLPLFVVYRSDSVDDNSFEKLASNLKERITHIKDTRPIGYKKQNGGYYTIPAPELQGGTDCAFRGFCLHIKKNESDNFYWDFDEICYLREINFQSSMKEKNTLKRRLIKYQLFLIFLPKRVN